MFLNTSSSSLTKPLTHKTVAVLACALAMKGLANVPAAANPAVPQSTERLPSLLIICPARLQRIEDFLCLHEIRGVEPLGEPAVDRREQIARFGAPVFVAPEAGKARRRAELERTGVLPLRDVVCPPVALFGFDFAMRQKEELTAKIEHLREPKKLMRFPGEMNRLREDVHPMVHLVCEQESVGTHGAEIGSKELVDVAVAAISLAQRREPIGDRPLMHKGPAANDRANRKVEREPLFRGQRQKPVAALARGLLVAPGYVADGTFPQERVRQARYVLERLRQSDGLIGGARRLIGISQEP